ncbi:MAG: glycosyltransferase family 2 protein [Acidobacteriota bacterium]|nr:glycosyltransferase family 2 protein [Acidobacteriota bacterium]
MPAPDLSIVIVTFNSSREIAACLASLPPALDGMASEVIVVDNASSDGTARLVADGFPGVRLIETGANLGFSGGVNAGLRAATGRYAAWLNPDSRVIDGRFKDVVDWLDAHPAVGIAGLKLVDEHGGVEPSSRGFPSYHSALGHRYSLLTRIWPANPLSRRYLRTGAERTGVGQADWVSGAALVHRRELGEQLGGLDERFFMYCEDVDFCYRAMQRQWETRYLPLVTVLHEIGASSRRVKPAMIRARHESLWKYYKKHFTRNPIKDAVTYAGIFTRCRFLLIYDALGGRRVK